MEKQKYYDVLNELKEFVLNDEQNADSLLYARIVDKVYFLLENENISLKEAGEIGCTLHKILLIFMYAYKSKINDINELEADVETMLGELAENLYDGIRLKVSENWKDFLTPIILK